MIPGIPDWSELPRELLAEISRKLPTFSDYLRFRAVCPSWRSAAKPGGAPRTSPCLLLEGEHTSESRPVHSLSTGTTLTLRIPEVRGKRVCGSSSGWLVMAERSSPVLTLLNPLTGSQIPLPPSPFPGSHVDAAFLSSAPTAPGCTVLVSLSESRDIAFCRLGPEGWWSGWTTIHTELPTSMSGSHEVACYKGKLCAVNDRGLTAVCEAGGRETRVAAPAPPETGLFLEQFYLVVEDSDEFLLVGSYVHAGRPYEEKVYFIFRLDESSEKGPPRWVNVRNMGGRSLFLCNCQSLSISRSHARGCREDCLYIPETLMERGAWRQNIIVYNWRTCDIERLHCKLECCLCFSRSPPTWFVPSL